MADYFAIATIGFFPTPTPTEVQRMAFAASWGYLDTLPFPPDVEPSFTTWGIEAWGRVKWGIRKWGVNG